MISHKLLGESFTGATGLSHPRAPAETETPRTTAPMVVFCIQRLLIAGRHRLWLRLRRYLIVFDPLTFVLD
jgi:hypothetical protein